MGLVVIFDLLTVDLIFYRSVLWLPGKTKQHISLSPFGPTQQLSGFLSTP